jgi:hypothetical protein
MFHHNTCILTASASTSCERKPLRLRRHGCDEGLPISMLEDPSAQRVVELYDGILKSRGRALSPASVILDYGCGSGRHAYEFLDAAFVMCSAMTSKTTSNCGRPPISSVSVRPDLGGWD